MLHTDPLTPLSTIKSKLFLALKETKPKGLNGRPLPANYSDIRLAKPINPLDASQGWESIDPAPALNDEESGSGKSKAKSLENTAIKATGVKDNSVVGFRWGEDDGEDDGTEEWDVLFPSYEDNYHVENEGDAGVSVVPKDFKD